MKLFRNYLTTKTLILPNFDINEMVLNIANKKRKDEDFREFLILYTLPLLPLKIKRKQ